MESSNGRIVHRPLVGVRVIDLSWVGAGPYSTELMALLGTEVIKVESSLRLDSARLGFFFTAPGMDESPNFNTMNLSKRSVALNLQEPRALNMLRELLAISDGVVDSFRPGVMARLGLGYQELRRINPTIIVLSLSSYGATGPLAAYPGNAGIFAAMSGASHLAGYPDLAPSTLFEPPDMRAGATAFSAFQAALYWRRRTGRGQFIDLSAVEANSALIGHVFVDYGMNRRSAMRDGNRHPWMAPHNCYPCRDRETWLAIAVGCETEWQGLVAALGNPDWARDPKFTNGPSRWRHRDELDVLIEKWTLGRTADEAAGELQAAGVPANVTKQVDELARDPHLRHRGLFVTTRHPKLGDIDDVGLPWLVDGRPASATASPLLGEHTDWAMNDLLGKVPSEVQSLSQDGVLR